MESKPESEEGRAAAQIAADSNLLAAYAGFRQVRRQRSDGESCYTFDFLVPLESL